MRRFAITLYLAVLFAPAVVMAAAAIDPESHALAIARNIATTAAICVAIGSVIATCALALVLLRHRKQAVVPAR